MFGGGGEDALAARLGMVTPSLMNPATSLVMSGEVSVAVREERGPAQPQWSQQETREFIAIRAELERDFTASKRNKTLWEVVSSKMRERGFRRSPEQCKCKWKNLVNRYKGKETSDPEHSRQCPFFEELHAVFTQRAHNMQRLLLESETRSAQTKKGVKRSSGDRSSEELSEDDDEVEYDSEEEKPSRSNTRKRKVDKVGTDKTSRANNPTNAVNSSIQEMLKEFFQHQLRMEMQWREMMERRAHERQLFEQEWRQSMEKLERERLIIEQAWREREEQRRMREESRAEKRDALLTTLLNKLINESN
ncbi:trihelix transcription factor GT-3b [Vigna radiata var. radiata]|uniref:Trihelix transcription factor GT-3b n=1 Tax=Vigna radiata var. radiata TaxID=3916 RepID=A0A1S3VTQ6_VIGRR|nr:trihelix transcription factor GT-3b [Vigna radiata var. radiata]